MKLVRQGSSQVIADEVERAVTFAARLRGLLGRSELPEGRALAIEPCNSVHTLFMRFPIDVVFLDREGRVLRAVHSLEPWRATWIVPKAALVVELPAGTLARTSTAEGDRLAFVEPATTAQGPPESARSRRE